MKLLYWTSLTYDYKEVSGQVLGRTGLQATHPDCASTTLSRIVSAGTWIFPLCGRSYSPVHAIVSAFISHDSACLLWSKPCNAG